MNFKKERKIFKRVRCLTVLLLVSFLMVSTYVDIKIEANTQPSTRSGYIYPVNNPLIKEPPQAYGGYSGHTGLDMVSATGNLTIMAVNS